MIGEGEELVELVGQSGEPSVGVGHRGSPLLRTSVRSVSVRPDGSAAR